MSKILKLKIQEESIKCHPCDMFLKMGEEYWELKYGAKVYVCLDCADKLKRLL